MDTNGDIEMQDQGDVNLEKGPTVADQADIEKEEAAPLLEKFTAVEVQEQTEETDVNLEKGPTVAVQADIEEEESAPLLKSFNWDTL